MKLALICSMLILLNCSNRRNGFVNKDLSGFLIHIQGQYVFVVYDSVNFDTFCNNFLWVKNSNAPKKTTNDSLFDVILSINYLRLYGKDTFIRLIDSLNGKEVLKYRYMTLHNANLFYRAVYTRSWLYFHYTRFKYYLVCDTKLYAIL